MVTSKDGPTTQSTVSYDETTDDSASENDGDDGSTILSYTPPRTPTNSLASVEVDFSYIDTTWQQDDHGGHRLQTQLASVVEEDEELAYGSESGSLRSSQDGIANTRKKDNVMATGVLRSSDVETRRPSSEPSEQMDFMFNQLNSDESRNEAGPSTLWTDTTGIKSTAVDTLSLDNKLDIQDDLPSSRVEYLHVLEQESQVDRDKRILEQLGYSEVLGRDYGFWASFSVGYCAFGGIQAAALNLYVTWVFGGTQ